MDYVEGVEAARVAAFALAAWLSMGSIAAAQDVTVTESSRPTLLMPLYAGNVALHAMDLLSTKRALQEGHREANPVIKHASFKTVTVAKFAASALTIYATERLWKKNRFAAIGLMIAADVGLAAVVANNYHISGIRAVP